MIAEIFRELGYEGASLGNITERTGLGKGSLYHFFPDGKEQMAAEILAHVDDWFARNVFVPLERSEPRAAVRQMWRAVDQYFHSGNRICLVGAFALDETRDRFAAAIRAYFVRWIDALRGALKRAGCGASVAQRLAEEAVLGIQGALVLARALDDAGIFSRSIARLEKTLSMTISAVPERPPPRSVKKR